jgi:hypothetical protein
VKVCSKCKQSKSLEEFDRHKSCTEQRRSHCKICRQANTKIWRQSNPKRSIEHTEKYQRANPEKTKLDAWKYKIKQKFNLSKEEYDSILANQNGVCAICFKTCISGRRLAVDHNHKTNKNRGLLCSNCNIGLGHLQEDIRILNSMIEYIKKHGGLDEDQRSWVRVSKEF